MRVIALTPTITRRLNTGFTLVELLIVVSIMAILVAMSVPSFSRIVLNQQISDERQTLYDGLRLARAEAVRRAAMITLCKSSNAQTCGGTGATWDQGWLIFVDQNQDKTLTTGEEVLYSHLSASSKVTVHSNITTISFAATGYLIGAEGGTYHFYNNQNAQPQSLEVNALGRPKIIAGATCPTL